MRLIFGPKINFVICFLLLTIAAVLPPRFAFGIVGGTAVLADDPIATSSVAIIGWTTIMGNIERPYYCSGTLIRPDVVLTAAHCLLDRRGQLVQFSKINVSFGLKGSEKTVGGNIRHIVDAKIHPNFHYTPTPGDSNSSDVGLLRLDSPAPAGFVSASLAETNPVLTSGAPVFISGYGVTDLNDRIMYSVGVLYKTQSPFTSFNVDGTELKLSVHGGGLSCLGDSGGPAYLIQDEKIFIVGITSHGTGLTCADGDQIFTSVAAQRQFIDSTIGAWTAPKVTAESG
jgi:secreted trypsin-like serine protease